jgi:hypothetical protein
MNTYRSLFGLIFLVAFSSLAAQDVEDRIDKIRAQKVAFITERLGLTSKEAQNFWPVYNEYQEKKEKLNAQRRSTREYYKQNANSITDKEVTDILNKVVSIEQQEVALFAEYNEKFKQVLPARKVMQLYIAENQFKAWIISRIRATSPGREGRRK